MTKYEFEGKGVLVKPPLQTESALVKDGVTVQVGDVVIDAGGADAGKYDLAGAGALNVKGVVEEKRVGASTEKRPVTAVAKGWVRTFAVGAITAGRKVKAGGNVTVATVNHSGVAESAAADAAGTVIGRYLAKSDGSVGNAANGDEVIIELDLGTHGSVT